MIDPPRELTDERLAEIEQVVAGFEKAPKGANNCGVFAARALPELIAEIRQLEGRVAAYILSLAALETAARAVCAARWSDERIKAIEELGRVVGVEADKSEAGGVGKRSDMIYTDKENRL